MTDLNVRSDAVDVEQVMQQIRARIREKRGADYTEAEVRELADVQLEKFIDPTGVRSDLVDAFRRRNAAAAAAASGEISGDESAESKRPGLGWLRWMVRRVLARSVRKIVNVHLQAREELYFEVMHNLVAEITRLGIDVRNLKMRVESLSSRLDFDERRGKALEGVVQYRPAASERPQERPRESRPAPPPPAPNTPAQTPQVRTGAPSSPDRPNGGGERPNGGADRPNNGGDRQEGGEAGRRRRRRRRRRPGQTMGGGGGQPQNAPNTSGPAEGAARPEAARPASEGGGTDDQ